MLEVLSLMSIGPIINLFNSNNNIEIPLLNQFNTNEAILISTLIFTIYINLVSFIKIKTISFGHFLSAGIGQEIGLKLIKNFLGHDFLIHKSRESTKVLNTFTIHLTQTTKFIFFVMQFIVNSLSTIFILSFIVFKTPLLIIGIFFSISLVYIYMAKIFKPKNIKASKNAKISADNISCLVQGINSNIEKYILNTKIKILLILLQSMIIH